MSERQSPSFSHVTFVPSFNQFLDLDIPLYGATPPPLNMSYDYLTSNVMAPPDHSGFIDLTTDPSPPTASGFPPVFRAATHRREEPSRKRRRVDHDFSGGLNVLSQPSARHIDEVDLTKVDDDAGLEKLQEEHRLRREEELQRQHEQQQEQKQAESIRSLHEQSRKPIRLSDLQCVVCMENMKNITATHCGMFCYCFVGMPFVDTSSRPPLLPHLHHGSSHCWRESRSRPRQRTFTMSCMS